MLWKHSHAWPFKDYFLDDLRSRRNATPSNYALLKNDWEKFKLTVKIILSLKKIAQALRMQVLALEIFMKD